MIREVLASTLRQNLFSSRNLVKLSRRVWTSCLAGIAYQWNLKKMKNVLLLFVFAIVFPLIFSDGLSNDEGMKSNAPGTWLLQIFLWFAALETNYEDSSELISLTEPQNCNGEKRSFGSKSRPLAISGLIIPKTSISFEYVDNFCCRNWGGGHETVHSRFTSSFSNPLEQKIWWKASMNSPIWCATFKKNLLTKTLRSSTFRL